MFYLTSKFHVNRINTFGFMEGGGLLKPPLGPGTPKKPRPNRANVKRCVHSVEEQLVGKKRFAIDEGVKILDQKNNLDI